MKRILFLGAGCWLLVAVSPAQTISQKLQKAFSAFEKDSQLKYAISSLYVIDAKTGQVVFDKNSRVGLAPASTQKIITSVTAFELLGKEYRYKTEFNFYVNNEPPFFEELRITGYGDPTFGSWRYAMTKPETVFSGIINVMKQDGVAKVNGPVTAFNNNFESVHIPAGWIWEDIGNYYGAGAADINWRENQFDLWLKPGKKAGDSVHILVDREELIRYINEVKTGKKGSGDNAYMFFNPTVKMTTIRGTIPCCVDSFKISGSVPDPSSEVTHELKEYLRKANIPVLNLSMVSLSNDLKQKKSKFKHTHYSPSLDSIIYWFNKKSVNLYGEALIKTFAYEKQGFGSTDSGVAIVKKFWKEKKLDPDEINIVDGSGLSPLNRVTARAQVEILKYAKSRDWFSYFYNSLPAFNGMIMKSGSIRGVKGFCGYHKAKNGKEYIFSFLVNNYNGPAPVLVNKMYRVLDILR